MQNLMEHSTHTLYISDESDSESVDSELSTHGKENISPERMAEILAVPLEERANVMRVDEPEKDLPRMSGREPLREMKEDELASATTEPDTAAIVIDEATPKLTNDSHADFFTTPKKTKKILQELEEDDEDLQEPSSTPKSPDSPKSRSLGRDESVASTATFFVGLA